MLRDVVIAFSAMPAVVPRGGHGVATLIAAIWTAVITAVVALEKNRNAFGWAAAAFIVTIVVISTALYFASR